MCMRVIMYNCKSNKSEKYIVIAIKHLIVRNNKLIGNPFVCV